MTPPDNGPFSPGHRSWWQVLVLSGPALGLAVVLVCFFLLIARRDGLGEALRFVSLRNLQVTVNEVTILAVVALGSLLVIISGGIDLSVGSVVALVTVVSMLAYTAVYERGGSVLQASLLAVLAGVLAGAACGLVNGLVITRLGVSPFVATLGMMSMARGLALYLAERTDHPFPGGRTPEWAKLFKEVHPRTVFNPGFWSLVLLAVLITIFLRLTVLGRYCYAIGSNEAAARLCGIPTARTKVILYTLAGLLTGWAGVLSFTSIGGAPSSSQGLELEVIAAVVIGGASLAGGQGTVPGTFLGVLILGILLNGVRFLGVPVDYRHILIGAVIILSTSLGMARSRLRRGQGD